MRLKVLRIITSVDRISLIAEDCQINLIKMCQNSVSLQFDILSQTLNLKIVSQILTPDQIGNVCKDMGEVPANKLQSTRSSTTISKIRNIYTKKYFF